MNPLLIPAPDHYRHDLGGLTVIALFDGILYLNASDVVGLDKSATAKLLNQNPHRQNSNGVITSIVAHLVEKNGQTVLIDTGAGSHYDSFNPGLGNIHASLKAAGVNPADIDHIFLTHNHDDHTGGLTDKQGKALYPNAVLWINKSEGLLGKDAAPYAKAGKIRYFTLEDTLPLDAKAIAAYGHTRGHTAFLFDNKLLAWGDIVHFPDVQFARTDAGTVWDSSVQQGAQSRTAIMRRAAENRWLVAGGHLDFPGLGYVSAWAEGFAYTPLEADK